jgi:hypothetical protein
MKHPRKQNRGVTVENCQPQDASTNHQITVVNVLVEVGIAVSFCREMSGSILFSLTINYTQPRRSTNPERADSRRG